MDFSVILDLIVNFALSNPKLAGACTIAYLIGLGAKTIREAVEKFVLESPSKEDDAKYAALVQKPVFKFVFLALDFLFRLKKPNSK